MSSDSDFDEKASDQKSDSENDGAQEETSTANGKTIEEPVTWKDLVS